MATIRIPPGPPEVHVRHVPFHGHAKVYTLRVPLQPPPPRASNLDQARDYLMQWGQCPVDGQPLYDRQFDLARCAQRHWVDLGPALHGITGK
ncbi:MAG TPA: hypothetical protein VFG53_19895 [Anaeromyxobacter sp.]|nr:hypothetical protein [Anaeromyxobacter sp.]